MNKAQPSSDALQVRELAAAVLANTATPEDQAALHDYVVGSPELRQVYLESICDEMNLSALLGSEEVASSDAAQAVPRSTQWWRELPARLVDFANHPMSLSLLIAGLFMSIIVLSMAIITLPALREPVPTPSRADNVARLVDQEEAVWRGQGESQPAIGDDLLAGERLHLASGFVRLRYDNGAQVLLEGPVEFSLSGDSSGSLMSGKAVVRLAPEQSGYVLTTQRATITDLGTEFGAYVDARQNLELAVFDGKVRLESNGGQAVLQSGQSARVAGAGIQRGNVAARFARMLPREEPGAYAQQVAALRPLAHYRFSSLASEQGDRFTVFNARVGVTGPEPRLSPDGGFAGFEKLNRWTSFGGGPRDYISNLKSGWDSNAGTICYWVRTDGDGHSTHTHLFASEDGTGYFGDSAAARAIATFARLDGSFGISVGGVQIETSAEAIKDIQQWNQLAFTWQRGDEPDSSRIAIYLNGQEVVAEQGLQWDEFAVTAACFGKELSGQSRLFKGAADELVIFEATLNPTVVKQLFEFASTDLVWEEGVQTPP